MDDVRTQTKLHRAWPLNAFGSLGRTQLLDCSTRKRAAIGPKPLGANAMGWVI